MVIKRHRSKHRRKDKGTQLNEEENQSLPPVADENIETLIEKLTEDKKKKEPVIVFAHGHGDPSSSDWMIRWKDMLAKAINAIEVVTFDYPYITGRKRWVPPKAEKLLVDFLCEIVKKTMDKYPGHPLVLAGTSTGSRVCCMVAGDKDIAVSALVCLGCPLKGMNAVRDETLLQLRIPVMFVQGSKDALCLLEQLEDVRKKMNVVTALHVIEGGDDSFKIAERDLLSSGSSQEEAEGQAVQAISEFVSRSLGLRWHLLNCIDCYEWLTSVFSILRRQLKKI